MDTSIYKLPMQIDYLEEKIMKPSLCHERRNKYMAELMQARQLLVQYNLWQQTIYRPAGNSISSGS